MRQLTAKQKKLLDIVCKEAEDNGEKYYEYQDLTNEVWEKLEKINDTEILWQEVNRYLWDRTFNN